MSFHIESILATTDLSEAAAIALRAAGALAALTDSELHVVHAVEAVDEYGIASSEELRRARAAVRDQLRGALPPSVDPTSTHVAPGPADEVILRRASEVKADLLVIGAHRGEPASGEPLGTIADRLVRTSDEPCLIVHSPISLPLRRILVPSDLSKAAEGALDVALIWGAALRLPTRSGERTRLDVVYATSEGEEVDAAKTEGTLRDQIAYAKAVTGFAGQLEVDTAVIQDGDAADAILHFARENRVDLIVLGTHGESGGSRGDVGSVSSAIAQRAERPVLLVPPGFWEEWRRRNEVLSGK